MALDIDPTAARRRPADLRELVDAIFRATPEDEQDWLEWKSSLDLKTRAAQFTLSRAILGMANRNPERAAVHAGGIGYVVVGAAPGAIAGVASVDTAKLDDALSRYLGAEGPQWSAHRVDFSGREVLVVLVEPPMPGDPMYPLCSSFHSDGGGAEDGTLFVRSGTKTRPASSADIRMLYRRAVADRTSPSEGPHVSVFVRTPGVPVLVERKVREILAGKADAKSESFLQDGLQRQQRLQEPSAEGVARALSTLYTSSQVREELKWETFVSGVTKWAADLRDAAWDQILWSITEARLGEVALVVENLSLTNLLSVEIVLKFPAGLPVVLYDENGAEEPSAPVRPKPYGEAQVRTSLDFASIVPRPLYSPGIPDPGRHGVYVDARDDGGKALTFVVGDLRPGQTTKTEGGYIILVDSSVSEEELLVEWTATSISTDGVRRGEVALPIWGEVDSNKACQLPSILE